MPENDNPDLLDEYRKEDPRILSKEAVEKAAKDMGITVEAAESLIKLMGTAWDALEEE